MKKSIDEKLNEEIINIDFNNIVPLFSFKIFGILFSVYKRFEFDIEMLETSPYRTDGKIPLIFLIFVDIGFLSLTFENKKLYKYLYRKKYREELDI